MASLTWEQALAWRMRRHHLVDRAAPSDLVRVAADICGLHAQLMSSAELSLWARIDGLEREAVEDALWRRRELTKLWAMRGTLHLLPSAELGTWLAPQATRSSDGNVGHPEVEALADAVGRALEGGQPMTRDELALAVERATGSATYGEWVRFSWGSYLKAACYRGALCFAPSDGTRVRFTSPASWVPGVIARPAPADALREVARRFIAAYAPIQLEDVARWWGDGRRQGARMLAAVGDDAVEVTVDGRPAWALAGDVPAMVAATPPGTARLLPGFDPWTVGALIGRSTSDPCAELLLGPGHRTRIFSPQGWISPVLLVDGRMAGVWRHARKGRRLSVELRPFGRLPAWARRQLEADAERLARFIGCPDLTIAP